MPLQVDIKIRLATLQWAENLRKLQEERTRFYKDAFKFVKDLFEKEKSRTLGIGETCKTSAMTQNGMSR